MPETSWIPESRKACTALCKKRDRTWRELDKYVRVFGHSIDDRHINEELVAEGYPWHYKKYSSDPQLADAELHARDCGLGLWRDEFPIAPSGYRDKPP